jgi:hypothetical protein
LIVAILAFKPSLPRLVLMLAAVLVASCAVLDGPVAIKTDPLSGGVCLLVPAPGVLVADSTWGLALQGSDRAGQRHRFGVIWPHGYTARRESGTVVLLDEQGELVAHEGDNVVLDAAIHDPLTPCTDIQIVPPPST